MRYRRGDLDASPSRPKAALLGALFSIAIGATTASGDGPGRPPSRLVPAQGLISYLEYDGLDAHTDAWKATAAWEILNGTPAGPMMTDVARQTFDRLLKIVPGNPFTGADLVALQDHITRRGFAVATLEEGGSTTTVFILNDFARKETLDRFHRLLRFVLKPEEGRDLPTPTQVRGRAVHVFRRAERIGGQFGLNVPSAGPTWWLEGDRLILVKGGPVGDPGAALLGPDAGGKDLAALHGGCVGAVLDAIEGKTPDAMAHPGIVAARAQGRDLAGFEPSGLFVVESLNGRGVLQEARVRDAVPSRAVTGESTEYDLAEAAGLGRARRVVGRWGFRGKALLTDVRFEAPGPWTGIVGMLGTAGFGKDRLPPIPRPSGAFAVGSFRRGLDSKSWEILRGMATADARPYLEVADRVLADAPNRHVLENVLGRLGPTWTVYAAPGGRADGEGVPTLLIGVADSAALARDLDAAAARLNAYLREQEFGDAPVDHPPALALGRLPAGERGYRLTSPSSSVPWLTDAMQPTILLGKSTAVVAANPALARAAIAAESEAGARWDPSGECARLFEVLPANVSFLEVGNPRDSCWPEALANLPRTAASSLGGFVGVDLGDAAPEARPSELLSLLGVRQPAGPTARVGSGKPLKADDVRSLLFPSLLAATVDDRGVRLLSLEALPFGCVWLQPKHEQKGRTKSLSIGLKFGPVR